MTSEPIAEATAPCQDAEPTPTPDNRKAGWKRRLSTFILVAGIIAAAFTLLPALPKERRVHVRLGDTSTVTRVELTWSNAHDGAPIKGNAWHFSAGTAPRSVVGSVDLPAGRYEVDATVERTEGRQSIRRVIAIDDSDQITIPVP